MAGARAALLVVVLLCGACLIPLFAQAGAGPIHSETSSCAVCHTAGAAVLRHNPAAARYLLRSDLEAACLRCHGSEGASHPTGMLARGHVPANLPLSRDGRVACYTCHVMHGESGHFADYTRMDNRRGGLCLSCHTLAELEK